VLETVITRLAAETLGFRHQPHVVKVGHPRRLADIAKRVDVTVTQPVPVLKRDAQLERGIGRAHELALINAEQLVKSPEGGDGCLPDAHGADLVGFHQRYVQQGAQLLRQRRSHGPAGGSTTGDDHALYSLILHVPVL